jgi:hypothetical protein
MALLSCCACVAGATDDARGSQSAAIAASFAPYRLGAPTSISLGFDIRALDGRLPSALTQVDFRYPANLGLATSELGVAACDPRKLQRQGPGGCPENSIMGAGRALAEFQASPVISEETAVLALVAGPSQDGYAKLLISATGEYPVEARIVMSTLLLPGDLRITVPLVPGVPEGPDVAVTRARVRIGGPLIYHRRSHGRRIAYRPRGILLPRRCPRGGFRFRATFSFLDGTQALAGAVVPCPPRHP